MSINTLADKAIFKNIAPSISSIDLNIVAIEKSGELELAPSTSLTVSSALSVLFAYIPTEIIALYVTVLAALGPITESFEAQWVTFLVFLVCTPLVVWVTYAAKVKALNSTIPYKFSEWPKWEMIASTIAFVSWGFALPQTPFNSFTDWYSSAIASVSILVTSTILSLAAPFFEKK